MEIEKRWISSKDLFDLILEQLANHRQAAFTVTGMSMWPFLCHGRDSVVLEELGKRKVKKGDVVLYRISEEHYILHRITKCYENGFVSTGDGNCHRDPYVPYGCIVARAVKFVRPHKTIDCDKWFWRIIFYIWMMLFPIRKYIFAFWFKIRKYIR